MSFTRSCRNIFAIGRNFADHAKELGNAVPSEPIVFLKPTSSFLLEGAGPIEVPQNCTNLHHEVELGVVIGKGGRDIKVADAMSHVKGYFLGLDMTARELQEQAKKKGLPWTVAKGMDTFAPVGDFVSKDSITDTSKVNLWCKVNGQERQNGSTSLMLFPVPDIVSYVSTIFTLQEGDVIYTGTPKGVGPVVAGDVIECGMVDEVTGKTISTIKFNVATRAKASL